MFCDNHVKLHDLRFRFYLAEASFKEIFKESFYTTFIIKNLKKKLFLSRTILFFFQTVPVPSVISRLDWRHFRLSYDYMESVLSVNLLLEITLIIILLYII